MAWLFVREDSTLNLKRIYFVEMNLRPQQELGCCFAPRSYFHSIHSHIDLKFEFRSIYVEIM